MSYIILSGSFATVLLSVAATLPANADSGTPPYQCELVAGQLPPGLSLTGCATLLPTPGGTVAAPTGTNQGSATIEGQRQEKRK